MPPDTTAEDFYSPRATSTLKPNEKKTPSRPANKAHQLQYKTDKAAKSMPWELTVKDTCEVDPGFGTSR